jgi:very-short-patch-repair endonuclease
MKKYIRTTSNLSDPIKNDPLFQELVKIRQSERYEKRVKYIASKRKRANSRKRINKSREMLLENRSKRLETSLPRSEVWFRNLYLSEAFNRTFKEDHFKDQFNRPFNSRYIPDVSNRGYRYIIEVDGSWHDQADVKLHDKKKDYYFKKRGYVVIRIKAYDLESYKLGMEQIKLRIEEINKLETEKRSK